MNTRQRKKQITRWYQQNQQNRIQVNIENKIGLKRYRLNEKGYRLGRKTKWLIYMQRLLDDLNKACSEHEFKYDSCLEQIKKADFTIRVEEPIQYYEMDITLS